MCYSNGTKLNAFPKNPTDVIKLEYEIPRSLSIIFNYAFASLPFQNI